MMVVAAACAAVLYFVLKKWLLPAYRDEPALVLDDKVLDLKNSYPPIPWTEIESLKYTYGRYGNVIGIKLKNLDTFLRNHSSPKRGWGLRFNKQLYGYHFALSTTLLKGNTRAIFDAMNDFFNRFRLGTPAFFFKDGNMELD